MTLDPKERFLKSPHAAVHQELVVKESLKVALEYALLTWMFHRPAVGTESSMALSAIKADGIKEFIHTFLNLAEPIQVSPKPIRQNLHEI